MFDFDELPESIRELTPDELDNAIRCANAYHAANFHPYINELDFLCVLCDFTNLDWCAGFMFVDGIWIEFDPYDLRQI